MRRRGTAFDARGVCPMVRALLPLLTVLLLPVVAGAQMRYAGLTYNYAFASSDLDRIVGSDSWYGMSLDIRRDVPGRNNVLVGLSTGWHVFYDNTSRVIEIDNGAVSGQQYRNFNVIPILANVSLFLGERGQPRPYVAFHAGPYYVRQILDIGLYRYTAGNWHFGIAPEAGVTFPVGRDIHFYVNGRYHYPFSGGDYLGGESLKLPFTTLGAGFAWSY